MIRFAIDVSAWDWSWTEYADTYEEACSLAEGYRSEGSSVTIRDRG